MPSVEARCRLRQELEVLDQLQQPLMIDWLHQVCVEARDLRSASISLLAPASERHEYWLGPLLSPNPLRHLVAVQLG